MTDVQRLLAAVQAISHEADVRILQVPDNEDMWVIRVAVHDVVLVETGGGVFDAVVKEATRKIESMSQRILMAVRPTDPPPKP